MPFLKRCAAEFQKRDDKMKIVSIIPIKLNNERLPGKNTKLLDGIPLVHYIQKTLLLEPRIDERYIFCSSDEIKGNMLPGFTFLKRPKYLDEPASNFTQIFSEFMRQIPADIYIYAHATAPFIECATVRECLDRVLSGEFDSAFCATKIQDFLWQDGKPLNFDAENLPRSQDLVPIYRETSGVYVFRRDVFLQYQRRIGSKPFAKEVTFREAVDINTSEDFTLAEIMLKSDIPNGG